MKYSAGWTEWVTVGGCSVTCGSGFTTRRRQCVNGVNCPGQSTDTQACNLAPCGGMCLCSAREYCQGVYFGN